MPDKYWRTWPGQLVALLLTVGLLAGCGAGLGDERTWKQGSGELPDSVGNADSSVMAVTGDPSADVAMPAWRKNAGYGEPTGKWFLQSGGGRLGYGLTGGTKRPGDEIAVSLFAHEEEFRLDRDIRVRLVELTDELEPAGIILDETVRVGPVGSHEIVYTDALPDRENVLYALGAEIIGPDGAVEDALAELIRVPAPEINASVMFDRTVYGDRDDEAILTVANAGPTVLAFGVDYRIEKRVDGEWRVVPLDLAFISIGIMLQPGQQYELKVDLRDLGPGEYRAVKSLWAEGLDLSSELAAEFKIE